MFEFILVIKVDYLSRHGVRKKVLLPVHSMAGLNRFLIRDMMFLLLQDTALLISGEYSKGKRDDSIHLSLSHEKEYSIAFVVLEEV